MLNPGSNNALGTESCVRLRGNKINDADCFQQSKAGISGLYHLGTKSVRGGLVEWQSKLSIFDKDVRRSLSKGYICEFTIQKCKSINQLELPNFIIVPPASGVAETVNFEEAKDKCNSLPDHRSSSWRLLRFRKQTQQLWYARLQQLLEANCLTEMSWWVDFENGFEKYEFDQTMSKEGIFESLFYIFQSLRINGISLIKIPIVWVDPVNGELLKKRDLSHCTMLHNGTITNELCYKKYQGPFVLTLDHMLQYIVRNSRLFNCHSIWALLNKQHAILCEKSTK